MFATPNPLLDKGLVQTPGGTRMTQTSTDGRAAAASSNQENGQETVTLEQLTQQYMPKAISEVMRVTGPATGSLVEEIIEKIMPDVGLFEGASASLSQACRLLAFMNHMHAASLKIVTDIGVPNETASTLDDAFNAAVSQLMAETWGMKKEEAEALFDRPFTNYKYKPKSV